MFCVLFLALSSDRKPMPDFDLDWSHASVCTVGNIQVQHILDLYNPNNQGLIYFSGWKHIYTLSLEMSRSALEIKIQKALEHREQSARRRRLPDPSNSPSSAGCALIDFNSSDYLSLSTSRALRNHFLQKLSEAPDVLGSGGSRLLVNGRAHADLEARLAAFFGSEAALLFNSGFDANVGFFSSVPQYGDVIVYDEYIHASVHDGMRASRALAEERVSFEHNSLEDMRRVFLRSLGMKGALAAGECSIFVAVESLYSMDGTFAPLREIVDLLDELFPLRNAYLVVDEAHSTGIYGPQGKGRVALLGLEDRVFARLHTFGKALAATGGLYVTFWKMSRH